LSSDRGRDGKQSGDTDEGSVRLEIAGETYERQLSRTGDQVQFGGEGDLESPEVADLFAFLLETNEARRSVARGDDLREPSMRPVDTDAIEADIRRLEDEKDRLNDELEAIDADRVAALVEYLADKSEYLVIALPTEDADSDEYRDATAL
jgi:hypothetical protein